MSATDRRSVPEPAWEASDTGVPVDRVPSSNAIVPIGERLRFTLRLMLRLRGQGQYPRRSSITIARDRDRHAREIADYAFRHVPFYRDAFRKLGANPSDIRGAADLARLPLVHRTDIQRQPDRFLSTRCRPERCLRLTSSGSSGIPVAVYHDPDDVCTSGALGERFRRIIAAAAGRRFGYREVRVLPPTSSAAARITEWLSRHTFLITGIPARRTTVLLAGSIQDVVGRLGACRPDVLSSYGSWFATLFRFLTDSDRPAWLPRVVVYGASAMPRAVRRRIGTTFGIEVLSNYHSVEASRMGFECERHLGLHINDDFYAIRIVDEEGRSLPAGSTGQVVVSNLSNRGTVLLNYCLGDLAAWAPEPCPCGRGLPLLSFVKGRSYDSIVTPSSEPCDGDAVVAALADSPGVWQFQIVQERLDSIRILVVVAPNADAARLLSGIRREIGSLLDGAMSVQIEFVDSIAVGPNGKHRPVVSRLASGAPRPEDD